MYLNEQQLNTLLDAIAAYRSVRIEDKEWMIIPLGRRMSPHELDNLADYLKSELYTRHTPKQESETEPDYPFLGLSVRKKGQ